MHGTHVHVLASKFTLCRDEESVHHVCMRACMHMHTEVSYLFIH